MILHSISIQNLGALNRLSHTLNEGLNLLLYRRTDELSSALRFVFNHREHLPESWIGEDTRIEAVVSVGNTVFSLIALPNESKKGMNLACYTKNGENRTKEYLYLTSHSPEQDLSDIFEGDGDTVFPRFLRYTREDLYYSERALSRSTDGLSDINAFRAYLRDFLKSFKPELLREGKQYEMVLEKDGRYAVKCRIDSSDACSLSVSERTLFRYLCFLKTEEFWCGFEELRNLHGIKKPLIIKDFLERLDESINTARLLKRAENLKRQVIVLSRADTINE